MTGLHLFGLLCISLSALKVKIQLRNIKHLLLLLASALWKAFCPPVLLGLHHLRNVTQETKGQEHLVYSKSFWPLLICKTKDQRDLKISSRSLPSRAQGFLSNKRACLALRVGYQCQEVNDSHGIMLCWIMSNIWNDTCCNDSLLKVPIYLRPL